MTQISPLTISGLLKEKDVKRLTDLTRGSTIGPTTLYYAGATAPVISAGISLMATRAFEGASFSAYWTMLLSALIAAMSGITWYLIFLRWSYRHKHGRGTELKEETIVGLSPAGLSVTRGGIKTEIDWAAVETVKEARKYTAITVDGADAIIVPNAWFDDTDARDAFREAVKQGTA